VPLLAAWRSWVPALSPSSRHPESLGVTTDSSLTKKKKKRSNTMEVDICAFIHSVGSNPKRSANRLEQTRGQTCHSNQDTTSSIWLLSWKQNYKEINKYIQAKMKTIKIQTINKSPSWYIIQDSSKRSLQLL
jgi:hypothetical protein